MDISAKIPVGATAERSQVVTEEMTVAYHHPDMPPVFGTPLMIYLMEVTASDAIEKYLPEGWVTVGVVVNVRHLAATPVGATVTAKAEVLSVDGYMVTFAIEAHDGVEKIGEGTHVRAMVAMDRFLKRVNAKARRADDEGRV